MSISNRSVGSFVIRQGANGLEVHGALTFDTARQARQDGLHVLSTSTASELELDCGGVASSDSAGLSVLLDWLSCARTQGRSLRLKNLPGQILAIAQISDVRELLQNGTTPPRT